VTDPRETVTLGYAEPVHGTVQGQAPVRVHPRAQCEGRGIPCCIHDPSPHHMRDWPMTWRADTGVMERACPHGTGHPDPDHMAYVLSLTPAHRCVFNRDQELAPGEWLDLDDQDGCPFPHLEWQAVHGCDGCCAPLLRKKKTRKARKRVDGPRAPGTVGTTAGRHTARCPAPVG